MKYCVIENNRIIMYFTETKEDKLLRNLMAKLGFDSIAKRLTKYLRERRVYRIRSIPKWFIKKVILDEFMERDISSNMAMSEVLHVLSI